MGYASHGFHLAQKACRIMVMDCEVESMCTVRVFYSMEYS